jgi:pyroglutamyl-peptidase
MTTVLITGFEPFGGDTVNPSMDVLPALQGWQPVPQARVATQVLPCVFGDALAVLRQAIEREQPAVVIALGLATNRDAISVERVAINVDDARIADNAGRQPIDRPVVPGGPAAYFSSLPIKAIVAAVHGAGIPAEVSQTAGTFVCNHVFYGHAHAIAQGAGPVRGGFIHLPPLPGQAPDGRRGMPLATMAEAVRIAARTALLAGEDLHTTGGAIA